MNVTLTVNIVLPAYLEGFFAALTDALGKAVNPVLVAGADAPAAEPKKRGRPAKSAEASGAELPTAPAETAPPKPAPEKEAPAGKVWTVTEVAAVVQDALPKIGVPSMKQLFAKFDGAKKVLDVPADKFGELVADIQSALGLVS